VVKNLVLMLDSSVRDPILTDHFWLNPLSQHFSQISVSDLILVNEDGDVVVGDEPINAAAFAIHSESKSHSCH
jgi:ribulose-5-phosphate 4-epimerase/fuculose-1-phosphate aldolase